MEALSGLPEVFEFEFDETSSGGAHKDDDGKRQDTFSFETSEAD